MELIEAAWFGGACARVQPPSPPPPSPKSSSAGALLAPSPKQSWVLSLHPQHARLLTQSCELFWRSV